jgi:hypothetical protein
VRIEARTMKMKKIKTDVEKMQRHAKDAEKKPLNGENQFFVRTVFLSIFLLTVLNFACTPRSFEKPNAAAPPSTAEDRQTSFQNELEKMRTANLQYVFVFRRKDGGAFDGEDKKFLRGNLPFNNRVVLADEDKAVIVGSNYKFPTENLDALRLRFNIEDYSAAEPAK